MFSVNCTSHNLWGFSFTIAYWTYMHTIYYHRNTSIFIFYQWQMQSSFKSKDSKSVKSGCKKNHACTKRSLTYIGRFSLRSTSHERLSKSSVVVIIEIQRHRRRRSWAMCAGTEHIWVSVSTMYELAGDGLGYYLWIFSSPCLLPPPTTDHFRVHLHCTLHSRPQKKTWPELDSYDWFVIRWCKHM